MADNKIANAIKFLKGEEKSLPATKTEGQVYFAYKNVGTAEKPSYTGAIYIDTPIGGTQNRIKMTANADIADKAFNDSAGLNIRDTYLSGLGYTDDGKQTILIKGSGNNQTRIALPIASTTKSGIVTTDAQSFGGIKTFTTINSTNLTVTGSNGFNYSSIGTGTVDVARPVWFADNSGNGKPVVNTNFTYNPATQTLKVANLSGTADKANKDSAGNDIRNTYISNITVNGTTLTFTKGGGATSSITLQDTNNAVTQTAIKSSDYTNWRTVLWGASNSATEGFTPTTVIDGTFTSDTLTFQPSSGTLKAKVFKGSLLGNASTATSATKATYDSSGTKDIRSYVSDVTISGRTITVTKGSGAQVTLTTQDTDTWRPLGTTGDTACAGNDSRLSNARPASDVYAWAKASTKPTYSWGEITGKPSTFNPSSHTHDYFPKSGVSVPNNNLNTCYTAGIYGYVSTTTGAPNSTYGHILVTVSSGNTHNNQNNWINQLAFATDGYIYHREKVNDSGWRDWEKIINTSSLRSYAAPKSHTHTKSQITDFPSSLPASDVYSWAKASSKPSYTKSEVGLGNVDNTADSQKSVKYATTSGSATMATKLQTYKQGSTTETYGTQYPLYAQWEDPTTLRLKSDNYTVKVNYADKAGSASSATNAATASKLQTARTITLAGSVTGSAVFDGSNNITITTSTNHSHSQYLPLAGGTMNGTSFITWADSGNWSNNNNNVTFPVTRGGLQWNGQSDYVKLFSQETGNDNLELVLQFGDDNSNGLSIRDCTGTQTARITAEGKITASSFIGNLNGNANTATALTSSAGSSIQPIYFSGGKPVACTYTLSKSVPADAKFTDTWRPLGTTGDTACAGNDSRLSNARPASDVYAWAKASNKPSYSWGEITGKPSTFTPSSHTHYSLSTIGDQRATATTPDSYSNTFVFQGLKNNDTIGITSTDTYSYVLGLRGWADATGGDSHELAFNSVLGILTRNGGTTWNAWRRILDSANYIDYTVTKNGLGASGTWGISVTGSSESCTGNAATATKLQTPRTINGTMFDGSSNITTTKWGTGRYISIRDCDSSNTGTPALVDGSSNTSLYMPSSARFTGTVGIGSNSGATLKFYSDATTISAKIVAYNDRIEFVFG